MKHEHDENAARAAELLAPLRAERPEWSPERRDAVWQDILAAQPQPRRAPWFLGLAVASAAAVLAGVWISQGPEAPRAESANC